MTHVIVIPDDLWESARMALAGAALRLVEVPSAPTQTPRYDLASTTVAAGGLSDGPALTPRERQVLHGMARGLSNAEIGRELFLSEDTVRSHCMRVFEKLGAKGRTNARANAVFVACQIGMLPALDPS